MKFVDEAIIEVQAGNGGPGCVLFRREKYVPRGGPDGGNGGSGGSIVAVADRNKHTLLDFQFQPLWAAEHGNAGEGNRREGRSGNDLRLLLPMGTEILNADTNELVCDLMEPDQEFILCKGGRGGRGNDFFKSATNRSPDYAQPGEQGTAGRFKLSLKLVADVGIIGFPNAGKSTLIARISAARPKIADYPFTTLTPNLGVVSAKGGRTFVVADVPGLIPGAHTGKGLGIKFLKHIERTALLLHLIDPNQLRDDGSSVSPEESYSLIMNELSSFSAELATRPQIVVITKCDSIVDKAWLSKAQQALEKTGNQVIGISSVTGENIDALIELLATEIAKRTKS